MKVWKRVELFLTDYLPNATHTSRMLRGIASEDVHWGYFSVEAKSSKTMPKYLDRWAEQASKNAGGAIPVICWHRHYMREGTQYVFMRLSDWREIATAYNSLSEEEIKAIRNKLNSYDKERLNDEKAS